MLTIEMLKKMEPGMFAKGESMDSPLGINMTNSGKMLKWVAVRGGIWDWTIYCHWSEDNSYEWICASGDKVFSESIIRRLVPCTDDAYKMYRR